MLVQAGDMNVCEICKKENNSLSALSRHVTNKHKEEMSTREYYLTFINSGSVTNCYCGEALPFKNLVKGFVKYCCSKCGMSSPERQRLSRESLISKHGSIEEATRLRFVKAKKTNLKRYGGENVFSNKEIQDKIATTNLERYGVSSPLQSKLIQDKLIATNLERYGVVCSLHNEEVKEKSKLTNLERYGVEFAIQSEVVKDKIKATCLEKYGVDNPWKSKHIRDKIKATNLERYGVDNFAKSNMSDHKAVTLKCEETCLERYGVSSWMKSEEYKLVKDDIMRKTHNTKKENGSYSKSIAEDLAYDKLSNYFQGYSILRQYSSKEYPFQCDFYIEELNCYIEYQGTWTHGTEPFVNSEVQQAELFRLQAKAKTSKYYESALHTWTVRDVNKRNTAIKNKIMYLEFFTIEELDEFINS